MLHAPIIKAAPPDFAALLAPYENWKLLKPRPDLPALEIASDCRRRIDPDIREITEDGVEIVFYGEAKIIRFNDITSLVIGGREYVEAF